MDRKRLAGTISTSTFRDRRINRCPNSRSCPAVQVQSAAVIKFTAIIIRGATGDLIGERIDLRMDQKKSRLDSNIKNHNFTLSPPSPSLFILSDYSLIPTYAQPSALAKTHGPTTMSIRQLGNSHPIIGALQVCPRFVASDCQLTISPSNPSPPIDTSPNRKYLMAQPV